VVDITPKVGASSKIEFARSFTEWFDVQGHFVALPFQTILATTVPLIAKADPKRAATVPPAPSTASPSFMNVDAETLDALAAAETTGAESNDAGSGGKKSKRRKA
jgi:hypothetical protein